MCRRPRDPVAPSMSRTARRYRSSLPTVETATSLPTSATTMKISTSGPTARTLRDRYIIRRIVGGRSFSAHDSGICAQVRSGLKGIADAANREQADEVCSRQRHPGGAGRCGDDADRQNDRPDGHPEEKQETDRTKLQSIGQELGGRHDQSIGSTAKAIHEGGTPGPGHQMRQECVGLAIAGWRGKVVEHRTRRRLAAWHAGRSSRRAAPALVGRGRRAHRSTHRPRVEIQQSHRDRPGEKSGKDEMKRKMSGEDNA